jgi:hypothetical protein
MEGRYLRRVFRGLIPFRYAICLVNVWLLSSQLILPLGSSPALQQNLT